MPSSSQLKVSTMYGESLDTRGDNASGLNIVVCGIEILAQALDILQGRMSRRHSDAGAPRTREQV